MVLKFFGACREVTGSCILVESGKSKVLLECGFFQGSELAEERNYSKLPFEAESVNALVLGHAHLDHVGRIPKLYRDGFRGKIYCTAPTKELARLVLQDSLKLMIEEASRNKHRTLYDEEDLDGVMELFEALDYNERLEIAEGIWVTLKNAGHILGSAVCLLESDGKKVAYTSDLGNTPSTLLQPPEHFEEADLVISESTYGGRVHEDMQKRREKLNGFLSQTIENSGVLLIPSFAIERTQELLHDIEHFCQDENCAIPQFYLDSPLAQKVTSVFEKYKEYLSVELVNSHDDGDIFGLKRLNITNTVEQSQAIDKAPSPKIIIAGSGMMNGGRILFHLQEYIEDANNALLIVGYQARGTLGRRLFEGEKEVKIFGKKYDVNARVFAIGSYSAHADLPQLVSWIGKIKKVKKVVLVHGEVEQAEVLARHLRQELRVDVEMPQLGEEIVV